MATVERIEAKQNIPKTKDDNPHRICGYCRVSTDKSDQRNSITTQEKLFIRETARHPNWTYIKTYIDDGISGTTTENRPDFLQMTADAKNGVFDILLVKEVSRFSRNVKDFITEIDKLKATGIVVVFLAQDTDTETENTTELYQYILAAERESRTTSGRVRIGQQQRMEDGVIFGRKRMYGYEIEKDEYDIQHLRIIEEEAEVIRQIFKWYISGDGAHSIARKLEKTGIPALYKNGWSNTVILRLIDNEKYVGDLRQGKTYTPDPMTHKKKYNRGESVSFYIRDHHPESAIIDRATWDKAQQIREEKKPSEEVRKKHENRYWLSGKVFCGECGERYISARKKQQNGRYKAWSCWHNHQRGQLKTLTDDKGNKKQIGCNNKRVNEKVLTQAMYDILTQIIKPHKNAVCESILAEIEELQKNPINNEKKIKKALAEVEKLKKRKSNLTDFLADETITKEEYIAKKNEYDAEINRLQAIISSLKTEDTNKTQTEHLLKHRKRIEEIADLKDGELNENLYERITKKIRVYPNRILEFQLSFLSKPIFLKYTSKGRTDTYTAEFEILQPDRYPIPKTIDRKEIPA